MPMDDGPLIGREDELAELRRALAPEGALVTLIGAPGMGTSRLGREVASRPFTRVRLVPGTGVAGIRFAEARELELLVVDDVDARVLGVLEELELLREQAPALRVLVIGDEALDVEGEQVTILGALPEDAAVHLYVERMPEVARSWAREGDVRELVRRLSGLPLAVELAALQAETYAARDLTGAGGGLDVGRFRTSRPGWPSRRSSLRGAFTAAWEALGAPEQAVLAAMATFATPPRLEDVDAMIDPSTSADPLAAVETLVRRQLVHPARPRPTAPDAGPGSSRLELAPLLADDLFVRTREAGRFPGLARRHAEVVLARLVALEPQLYGPGSALALEETVAALPEVRAAFARVVERAPDLAARLVVPLGELAAFARGISTDDPLFAAAVIAADRTDDPTLRARTRQVRACMLLERNEPRAALALLEEARLFAARNRVTDATIAADLERTRGWSALALRDLDGAADLFERALQDLPRARSPRGQADACAGLALVAQLRGDEAAARRLFESSYGLHLLAGDPLRPAKVREMARLVGIELSDADAILRLEVARRLAQGGAAAVAGWQISLDAGTVVAPDGARVDLRTRPVLRRILSALAAARVATPGLPLGVDQLLAAGWPGERVSHAAGLLRVYTAIKRLRALGLQTLVRTSEDGYLLDVSRAVGFG